MPADLNLSLCIVWIHKSQQKMYFFTAVNMVERTFTTTQSNHFRCNSHFDPWAWAWAWADDICFHVAKAK